MLFDAAPTADGDASLGDDAAPPDPVGSDASLTDWDEPNYQRRLPFTLTSPVAEDLDEFPVLLIVDASNLGGEPLPATSKIKLVHNGALVPVQLDQGINDLGNRINLWFQADMKVGITENYFLYFDSAEGDLGDSGELWSSFSGRWRFPRFGETTLS